MNRFHINCVDIFLEGSIERAKHPQKQVSTEDSAFKEKDLIDAPIEEEVTVDASSTIIFPVGGLDLIRS